MTRAQHLKFCKKCVNRKFHSEHGIICNLTDKIADFDSDCKNFIRDESVKEEVVPEMYAEKEVLSVVPEDIKDVFRAHQELGYAVLGGLFISILSALVWAIITVSTEFQIAYMAIGVGLVVGLGVRFFGAGIDSIFGFIGAFFALLGCVLGNLFSQVGFIADAESLGYMETLMYLRMEDIIMIFKESFSVIDLLFYGLAAYEGYRFAFRPVTVDDLQNEDLTPKNSKLRLPLAFISFVIISFLVYTFSKGLSGQKTYRDGSGAIVSSGEFDDGEMVGSWNYFYKNGNRELIAQYDRGIESGKWIWNFENGQIRREGNYKNGLYHGVWIGYYLNGVMSDSSNYSLGRLTGEATTYYDNGQVIQKGWYKRDLQDGFWKGYHENGKKNSEGIFENGERKGVWKYWDQKGNPIEELKYVDNENFKVLNAWNSNGDIMVKDGEGEYKTLENGSFMQSGHIKNGERVGIWKLYHSNGKLIEEGRFENGKYKVSNTWSENGVPNVIDGEGDYISYYGNSGNIFEKGVIKNGSREGLWETNYDSLGAVMYRLNYLEGILHGKSETYYLNENLLVEGNIENGEKVGKWSWYYEFGEIQSTANFVKGKKEGSQLFWSESAHKVKEELYKSGVFVSEKLL